MKALHGRKGREGERERGTRKAATEAAAALQQCSHHEKDGVRSPEGGSVNVKKLFFSERRVGVWETDRESVCLRACVCACLCEWERGSKLEVFSWREVFVAHKGDRENRSALRKTCFHMEKSGRERNKEKVRVCMGVHVRECVTACLHKCVCVSGWVRAGRHSQSRKSVRDATYGGIRQRRIRPKSVWKCVCVRVHAPRLCTQKLLQHPSLDIYLCMTSKLPPLIEFLTVNSSPAVSTSVQSSPKVFFHQSKKFWSLLSSDQFHISEHSISNFGLTVKF